MRSAGMKFNMVLSNARRGAGRALLLGISAVLLQGCILSGLESVTREETSLASSFVRPEDPQEEIGAREHPLVLAKYGGEYNSSKAEKTLALIVGKLISVSDDPSRVYKVTILNTPKVNAFALPGGYLYITRGLLALANDSSEIAAVIAPKLLGGALARTPLGDLGFPAMDQVQLLRGDNVQRLGDDLLLQARLT